MPRESLGYVRMVWFCPNCQSKNPGNFRFCRGCGAAQPADVQFVQDEQQEMVSDQKEIEQAKLGADVHCGFCGARNPASATVCQSCSADLATGIKRESGTVVGAYQAEVKQTEVPCPHCGTLNPESALTCKSCGGGLGVQAQAPAATSKRKLSPLLLALLIGLPILCGIVLLVVLLTRSSDVTGKVSNLSWQRSIAILALGPVERQDWKDQVPSDAELGTCEQRLYKTSDQPEGNSSQKVCGTPYKVDKGNGYAEVVQDCQYEIYADYCSYTVQDWSVVDKAVTNGSDNQPAWPALNLSEGQKAGEQTEVYRIVFSTNQGEITYQTSDPQTYMDATPGSRWTLKINGFGAVTGIEPAP